MTARIAPLTAAALAAAALWLMFADAPAATAGVRILSPAEEAVVPQGPLPVRLAVRNVRGLRVSVDDGDVTGRLSTAGGSRTAVLRAARMRPGAHWLVVRWRAAEGRRTRVLTRRFMVARRQRQLAARLAPRAVVDSTSGVAKLRLRVRRGVGLVRVWVNGRRVRVPHVGRLWPATTLRLGARHRLRFGRNRVRVLVHDFRRARYDVETWTVKVRRTRPLAAGTSVYRAKAGGRAVRLDGRGARPTRPGRTLSWRWRIVRRPRGSRARLVGASSPTPRLRLDVRGRYTVAQRISERGRGARAAAVGATSHRVTVIGDTNVTPLGASIRVDLTPSSRGGGSITVDASPSAGPISPSDCTAPPPSSRRCVWPNLAPDENAYYVVLDAVTLEWKAFGTVGFGCPRDFDLHRALDPWAGKNVIAILASGRSCHYSSLPPTITDFSHPFTAVFTPTSKADLGIRSGWYSEAPADDPAPAEISGYLQKSWPVGSKRPSQQYRFVPGNYVAYDTSRAGAPAAQNTMTVGDRAYTSQLPAGAADGFQVLVLDKLLEPMLGTPTTFANGAPIGDMATLLQRARTTPGVSTVLVQSIGRPSPYNVSANDPWNNAAAQLEQLGGNTDVFLSLKGTDWKRPEGKSGWYSLVAAPDPNCAPNASLPCDSAAEASTPLTGDDGDLSGVLGRNQRWQYAPLLDQAGGEAGAEIVTLAYQKPQTWPYSDAASRPVLEYLANYQQGATDLTWLKEPACYDPGPRPDVRSSYCSNTPPWDSIADRLGDSETGTGVCARYPGVDVVKVAEDVYHRICDRISLEALWLNTVHSNMKKLEDKAFGSDQALTAYMAVENMATEAKSEVETSQAKASRNVATSALELTGESLELVSLFAAESLAPVGEIFAGVLALAGEVTELDEGGEQGESAVGQLVTVAPGKLAEEMEQQLNTASLAFDHSWELIVSDPSKLETAYNNFKRPWLSVPEQMDDVRPMIQNGVRHWASGQFMAATYDVWMLDTGQTRGEQARDVGPSDVQTIGCDRHSSLGGNTTTWAAFGGAPPEAAYYVRDRLGLTQPKLPNPVPRYGSNIWVFAGGNVSDPRAARVWPTAKLIDDLLAPPQTQGDKPVGGYGWERPWLYSRGQRFNIHSPGWTAQVNGCYWFAGDRYPVCSWAPPPCTPRSAAAKATSGRSTAASRVVATRPRR